MREEIAHERRGGWGREGKNMGICYLDQASSDAVKPQSWPGHRRLPISHRRLVIENERESENRK
jgi:hypothetical protein